MPFTVEQLFQMGAHHTVEYYVSRGEFSVKQITDALSRRFGAEIGISQDAVAELRSHVIGASNIANLINAGFAPQPSELPINPALSTPFSYSVIAEIPDPIERNKTISIPWSVTSESALTPEQLLAQAGQEIATGVAIEDSLPGAAGTRLSARQERFREQLASRGLGAEDITLTVVAGYRRD